MKTGFAYEDGQVLMEYDESGDVPRKFIYGPGIDEPILMEAGGEKYFYHFNALGSVMALTDSLGDAVETYRCT